jgi:DNA transposition AAA+ family ATPase
MLRLRSVLRNPFSFLFAKTSNEERVASYLIREHARGRRLDDILQDRYVQNRLTPAQQGRVLEREDVVRRVSADDLTQARGYLAELDRA